MIFLFRVHSFFYDLYGELHHPSQPLRSFSRTLACTQSFFFPFIVVLSSFSRPPFISLFFPHT